MKTNFAKYHYNGEHDVASFTSMPELSHNHFQHHSTENNYDVFLSLSICSGLQWTSNACGITIIVVQFLTPI